MVPEVMQLFGPLRDGSADGGTFSISARELECAAHGLRTTYHSSRPAIRHDTRAVHLEFLARTMVLRLSAAIQLGDTPSRNYPRRRASAANGATALSTE